MKLKLKGNKRNHLTLEKKYFIVQEMARKTHDENNLRMYEVLRVKKNNLRENGRCNDFWKVLSVKTAQNLNRYRIPLL